MAKGGVSHDDDIMQKDKEEVGEGGNSIVGCLWYLEDVDGMILDQ